MSDAVVIALIGIVPTTLSAVAAFRAGVAARIVRGNGQGNTTQMLERLLHGQARQDEALAEQASNLAELAQRQAAHELAHLAERQH